MRLPLLAAVFGFALAACAGPSSDPAPEQIEDAAPASVENAWIRLPAAEGRPAAGYFTINGGDAGATMIAVESAAAERVELHETTMEDGVMRMRAVETIEAGPGESVSLAPGGLHLMLFGLDPELAPGATVALEVRFADDRSESIEAQTVAPGGSSPYE